jgi:hypothetical protein
VCVASPTVVVVTTPRLRLRVLSARSRSVPVSDAINRVGGRALMRKSETIQRAAQGQAIQCGLVADSSLLFVYGRKGKDITQPSLLVDKYAGGGPLGK